MHATHLTKKFNVLAVVYFTIIACGQIVLFPQSQPIFLFLVTMAMAVRLFTLRPQYKNLRFLVLSIISHHLVFTILSLIQLYIDARYSRASFIEYQMVYSPLLIGMGYVYFNVWRART
ncbi:hypothetical protein EAO08_27465 [Klebsiella pneumoniae]|uniref:hypothetical protein n=1 Tax=Enterobacteriaceae TaxID=543 RepID=UPI000808A6CD|nr:MULTISPECIES: hypothetical protein [Enterobacteriaceae]ARX42291.1 hypothetical protein AM404_28565 [Klebsiella pneumoniae]QDJ80058.1 hypothetical protein CI667_0026525 [Klebsiella pneumoniae subsp. pneumoniae]SCA22823.1 Uncharacterised protein [Klebsiella quasipneumoniae]EIW8765859.1 hypothetical protein [Klebsiella pneumoniae]MBA0077509.1 hypothetical protein [Klebsiella pneumoniae]